MQVPPLGSKVTSQYAAEGGACHDRVVAGHGEVRPHGRVPTLAASPKFGLVPGEGTGPVDVDVGVGVGVGDGLAEVDGLGEGDEVTHVMVTLPSLL